MFKKNNERNTHFLILTFLIGLFVGINFSFIASANEATHKYLDYFHRVYQIIKTDAVDLPPTKNIFYGAIRGMIKSLNDPFSRFLDEKASSDLKEMTTGKFVGVGIEITVRDGEVVVITPMDDSPAMRAGIKAGDVITKVNSVPIKDMRLSDIVKMIKGLPKSKVKLYIKREGFDEEIEIEVERAPIKIKSVVYSVIKDKKIGYIKLKHFASDSTKDVRKALKYFKEKNIDKIIMDLRYNPGGLLNVAVDISDQFLDKNKVIVSTRGRKGTGVEKIFKSKNKPIANGKLIVLVNNGSASASEIFAGAIRDNKRGKLLGAKTFGKGSVQKSFSLDSKVGVAITIAKYYTPSGELIHKKGIKPDYNIPVDTLTKADSIGLKRIIKGNLMDKFYKKGMNYNDENKQKFMDFLKEKNITLSLKTAHFHFKNRINRYKKRSAYDLEFDNQLVKAIEKINE